MANRVKKVSGFVGAVSDASKTLLGKTLSTTLAVPDS